MNRQNFFGHLALALSLILVAGFAGQLRRIEKEQRGKKQEVRLKTESVYPARHSVSSGSVLVKFRSSESAAEIDAIVADHHDEIKDKIESLDDRLVALSDLDGLDADAVAAQYRVLSEVEYAEVNQQINLDPQESPATYFDPENYQRSSPNDPQFAEQWALENTGQRGGTAESDIRAILAWSKTEGNSDVVVAVLDSGVDYTHRDLMQNMWIRPSSLPEYVDNELGYANDEHGFNAVDNLADPMDDNGHGTHCAGIIGAEGDNDEGIAGVNWHVQIMPLKFIGPSGSGTTKDAIEAINYAIERKRAGVNIRAINASWGSRQYSKALEDVIREAGDEGILFIAAAGNASTDNDSSPHYPSNYDLPNVISVAATDRNDELAGFSNYGIKSVQIAAPGADIMSTWLGHLYEEHSGTSMAAPVVTGVAALVVSSEPNISMRLLRARLMASVDKLPQLKGKVETGGRINAAKAVGAN
jgi:subtilisin family serine protease